MYLCYIDESGTSSIPGNTSHFVLAGVSVPIWHWRDADRDITTIKTKYGLSDAEIHTAWLLRKYLEQSRIRDFDALDRFQRRSEVRRARNNHLLTLQRIHNSRAYRQAKKNYAHTDAYIHMNLDERRNFVQEIADCIASWGFARLFAECIDKTHFVPSRSQRSVDEQAFEQVISRFEQYLRHTDDANGQRNYGLIVHDNNETVAREHTKLMRGFHERGTLWTNIQHIIETPLFVDSELTSMVQIADLCCYSLRRYLENSETDLFDRIFTRADRSHRKVVGVRHFSAPGCACEICKAHSRG